MNYKTIEEMLLWLEEKSKKNWILLDTETTGLKGSKVEQLTQVSAKVATYDFKYNKFIYKEDFDEKIELTESTKKRFDEVSAILDFNHYKDGDYIYKNENEVLDNFFSFVGKYSPSFLVAQNAPFDIDMLSGRYGHIINEEVFDTKMLIRFYLIPILQKLAETDNKYKELIETIGTSDRDNGLISSSLSKIGPALGINMKGYHDALTDCVLMADMFLSIKDIMEDNFDLDIEKYQIERVNSTIE